MTKNQAFTILQRAGGIRAARIITDHIKKMSKIRVLYIAHLLKRDVPVAKIIHQKWFYGLPFYTNKHTLDPRPDTETLVSAVISDCANDAPRRILDIGTGTGCIICSLVKNIQNASGLAIDISRPALRVARRNINSLNLGHLIRARRANFNQKNAVNGQFDIIVSNPPYIALGDTRVNDGALHDPKIALYATNNGLGAYESLARNAKHWLNPMGKIYLEIGINQGTQIKKIFKGHNWHFIESKSDLAGIERVLIFQHRQQ